MTTTTPESSSSGFFTWLNGDAGLGGRIVLSWALAGGLSMEVVMVTAAFLSGSAASQAVPLTATINFIVGAAGGVVHGLLVGIAGRASDVSLGRVVRGLEAGVIWAIPALVVGWVAALWISMTSLAVTLGRPGLLVTTVAGWLACVSVCVWALAEARVGLRYAMMRWPERRPGAPLVAVTFLVLALAFLWVRPEVWFTDLRVSAVGAVVLALGATIWIALPVEVLVLHFLHQWHAESPIWDGPDPGVAERSN